jgi:hypothetical protein
MQEQMHHFFRMGSDLGNSDLSKRQLVSCHDLRDIYRVLVSNVSLLQFHPRADGAVKGVGEGQSSADTEFVQWASQTRARTPLPKRPRVTSTKAASKEANGWRQPEAAASIRSRDLEANIARVRAETKELTASISNGGVELQRAPEQRQRNLPVATVDDETGADDETAVGNVHFHARLDELGTEELERMMEESEWTEASPQPHDFSSQTLEQELSCGDGEEAQEAEASRDLSDAARYIQSIVPEELMQLLEYRVNTLRARAEEKAQTRFNEEYVETQASITGVGAVGVVDTGDSDAVEIEVNGKENIKPNRGEGVKRRSKEALQRLQGDQERVDQQRQHKLSLRSARMEYAKKINETNADAQKVATSRREKAVLAKGAPSAQTIELTPEDVAPRAPAPHRVKMRPALRPAPDAEAEKMEANKRAREGKQRDGVREYMARKKDDEKKRSLLERRAKRTSDLERSKKLEKLRAISKPKPKLKPKVRRMREINGNGDDSASSMGENADDGRPNIVSSAVTLPGAVTLPEDADAGSDVDGVNDGEEDLQDRGIPGAEVRTIDEASDEDEAASITQPNSSFAEDDMHHEREALRAPSNDAAITSIEPAIIEATSAVSIKTRAGPGTKKAQKARSKRGPPIKVKSKGKKSKEGKSRQAAAQIAEEMPVETDDCLQIESSSSPGSGLRLEDALEIAIRMTQQSKLLAEENVRAEQEMQDDVESSDDSVQAVFTYTSNSPELQAVESPSLRPQPSQQPVVVPMDQRILALQESSMDFGARLATYMRASAEAAPDGIATREDDRGTQQESLSGFEGGVEEEVGGDDELEDEFDGLNDMSSELSSHVAWSEPAEVGRGQEMVSASAKVEAALVMADRLLEENDMLAGVELQPRLLEETDMLADVDLQPERRFARVGPAEEVDLEAFIDAALGEAFRPDYLHDAVALEQVHADMLAIRTRYQAHALTTEDAEVVFAAIQNTEDLDELKGEDQVPEDDEVFYDDETPRSSEQVELSDDDAVFYDEEDEDATTPRFLSSVKHGPGASPLGSPPTPGTIRSLLAMGNANRVLSALPDFPPSRRQSLTSLVSTDSTEQNPSEAHQGTIFQTISETVLRARRTAEMKAAQVEEIEDQTMEREAAEAAEEQERLAEAEQERLAEHTRKLNDEQAMREQEAIINETRDKADLAERQEQEVQKQERQEQERLRSLQVQLEQEHKKLQSEQESKRREEELQQYHKQVIEDLQQAAQRQTAVLQEELAKARIEAEYKERQATRLQYELREERTKAEQEEAVFRSDLARQAAERAHEVHLQIEDQSRLYAAEQQVQMHRHQEALMSANASMQSMQAESIRSLKEVAMGYSLSLQKSLESRSESEKKWQRELRKESERVALHKQEQEERNAQERKERLDSESQRVQREQAQREQLNLERDVLDKREAERRRAAEETMQTALRQVQEQREEKEVFLRTQLQREEELRRDAEEVRTQAREQQWKQERDDRERIYKEQRERELHVLEERIQALSAPRAQEEAPTRGPVQVKLPGGLQSIIAPLVSAGVSAAMSSHELQPAAMATSGRRGEARTELRTSATTVPASTLRPYSTSIESPGGDHSSATAYSEDAEFVSQSKAATVRTSASEEYVDDFQNSAITHAGSGGRSGRFAASGVTEAYSEDFDVEAGASQRGIIKNVSRSGGQSRVSFGDEVPSEIADETGVSESIEGGSASAEDSNYSESFIAVSASASRGPGKSVTYSEDFESVQQSKYQSRHQPDLSTVVSSDEPQVHSPRRGAVAREPDSEYSRSQETPQNSVDKLQKQLNALDRRQVELLKLTQDELMLLAKRQVSKKTRLRSARLEQEKQVLRLKFNAKKAQLEDMRATIQSEIDRQNLLLHKQKLDLSSTSTTEPEVDESDVDPAKALMQAELDSLEARVEKKHLSAAQLLEREQLLASRKTMALRLLEEKRIYLAASERKAELRKEADAVQGILDEAMAITLQSSMEDSVASAKSITEVAGKYAGGKSRSMTYDYEDETFENSTNKSSGAGDDTYGDEAFDDASKAKSRGEITETYGEGDFESNEESQVQAEKKKISSEDDISIEFDEDSDVVNDKRKEGGRTSTATIPSEYDDSFEREVGQTVADTDISIDYEDTFAEDGDKSPQVTKDDIQTSVEYENTFIEDNEYAKDETIDSVEYDNTFAEEGDQESEAPAQNDSSIAFDGEADKESVAQASVASFASDSIQEAQGTKETIGYDDTFADVEDAMKSDEAIQSTVEDDYEDTFAPQDTVEYDDSFAEGVKSEDGIEDKDIPDGSRVDKEVIEDDYDDSFAQNDSYRSNKDEIEDDYEDTFAQDDKSRSKDSIHDDYSSEAGSSKAQSLHDSHYSDSFASASVPPAKDSKSASGYSEDFESKSRSEELYSEDTFEVAAVPPVESSTATHKAEEELEMLADRITGFVIEDLMVSLLVDVADAIEDKAARKAAPPSNFTAGASDGRIAVLSKEDAEAREAAIRADERKRVEEERWRMEERRKADAEQAELADRQLKEEMGRVAAEELERKELLAADISEQILGDLTQDTYLSLLVDTMGRKDSRKTVPVPEHSASTSSATTTLLEVAEASSTPPLAAEVARTRADELAVSHTDGREQEGNTTEVPQMSDEKPESGMREQQEMEEQEQQERKELEEIEREKQVQEEKEKQEQYEEQEQREKQVQEEKDRAANMITGSLLADLTRSLFDEAASPTRSLSSASIASPTTTSIEVAPAVVDEEASDDFYENEDFEMASVGDDVTDTMVAELLDDAMQDGHEAYVKGQANEANLALEVGTASPQLLASPRESPALATQNSPTRRSISPTASPSPRAISPPPRSPNREMSPEKSPPPMSRRSSRASTDRSHSSPPASPPLPPLSSIVPDVSPEELEEQRLELEQEAQAQLDAQRQEKGLRAHETEAVEDLQQRAELGEVRVDEEYILGYTDRLLESLDLNRVLRDAVASQGNDDDTELVGTDIFERIEQQLEDRTNVSHVNQRAMHLLVVDTMRGVLAEIVASRRPVEQWQQPARGISALEPCIWRSSDTVLVQESVRRAFARMQEWEPVDELQGLSEQEKEDGHQAQAIIAMERGSVDYEMKHTAEDEENVKIQVADMILSDLLFEMVYEMEPNAPEPTRRIPSVIPTEMPSGSSAFGRVKLGSLPSLAAAPSSIKKEKKSKKVKKDKKEKSKKKKRTEEEDSSVSQR